MAFYLYRMTRSNKDRWLEKRKMHRERMRSQDIYQRLIKGDRVALSEGITLVESTKPSDEVEAQKLIELCMPHSGNSVRIGITGVPGVGKSTFIETFGKHLIAEGSKIAVLAVDPTSSISKGSILGDKTRMEELSNHESVFIRPTAAGDSLGGVARKTRESIILCEAAGFDKILIETVGVGQSETVVSSMVDFFLLLMLSGAGDELQGIKKGIMEMADAVVITKADGENAQKAKKAAAEYKGAIHLFQPNSNGWTPKVLTCSALKDDGVDNVVETINSYVNTVKVSSWFEKNRAEQDVNWYRSTLNELILKSFYKKEGVTDDIKSFDDSIRNNEVSPFKAAEVTFKKYQK